MDQHFDQPVLIIKTAWGGKSLFYDFRPPSAGPYERTEHGHRKGSQSAREGGPLLSADDRSCQESAGGHPSCLPSNTTTRKVTSLPDSSGSRAGTTWSTATSIRNCPARARSNRFAKYSQWLGDFIRDVRHDLHAPELPFVIGVMGVGGEEANQSNLEFRHAMAAPAGDPEFKGTVVAVQTAPFWDDRLGKIDDKVAEVRQMGYLLRTKNKNHANRDGTMTEQEQREYLKKFEADLISPEEVALRQRGASNAGYHYLGCAKTFALMGKAYAEALIKLGEAQN